VKKEVLGLNRKELLIYACLIAGTFALIIFSSIRLIHKYYTKDHAIYAKIQNHSNDLAYLNDLSVYAVNAQRNSLNILVYRANHAEVMDFVSKINNNRDSLLDRLTKMEGGDIIEPRERKKLFNLGIKYLGINTAFLKMLNDSTSNDKLTQFNTDKMRPAIREFSDLDREITQQITSKIKNTVNTSDNIVLQFEFWLLLLGLAPYLYFFYRILSIIARMILWELFPKKSR
jgi:hypothetical protein